MKKVITISMLALAISTAQAEQKEILTNEQIKQEIAQLAEEIKFYKLELLRLQLAQMKKKLAKAQEKLNSN
jgi:hypothetical protein